MNKLITAFLSLSLSLHLCAYADDQNRPINADYISPYYQTLVKGVSIMRWFRACQTTTTSEKNKYCSSSAVRENYITASDVQAMKKLGLTFVRIFVDPEVFYNYPTTANPYRFTLRFTEAQIENLKVQNPNGPIPVSLSDLRFAINLFIKAGMGVVLVPEYSTNKRKEVFRDFKPDSMEVKTFLAFHGKVLIEYAKIANEIASDKIFVDVLNEPPIFKKTLPAIKFSSATTPERWQTIQQEWLEKVRAAVGNYPILIASPAGWGHLEYLNGPSAGLKPYAIPNVYYAIHQYDSDTLSGQGIPGPGRMDKALIRGLPFPLERNPDKKSDVKCVLKDGSIPHAEDYLAITIAPDGSDAIETYARNAIDSFPNPDGDNLSSTFVTCGKDLAKIQKDKRDPLIRGQQTQDEALIDCAKARVESYLQGSLKSGECFGSEMFSNVRGKGIVDSILAWQNDNRIPGTVPAQYGGNSIPRVYIEEFGVVKQMGNKESTMAYLSLQVDAYKKANLHWNLNEYVAGYNPMQDPQSRIHLARKEDFPETVGFSDAYSWGLFSDLQPGKDICNRHLSLDIARSLGLKVPASPREADLKFPDLKCTFQN